ncbi:hypothetical protein DENSPDRAFT_836692 [Dentipellis sp. KUC8613]|nr:hypothetical protein DENSPDRAFT_836692 [Dentipellis sp. KUC8613]
MRSLTQVLIHSLTAAQMVSLEEQPGGVWVDLMNQCILPRLPAPGSLISSFHRIRSGSKSSLCGPKRTVDATVMYRLTCSRRPRIMIADIRFLQFARGMHGDASCPNELHTDYFEAPKWLEY